MGSKLFYELDRAAGSARTDVHNGTVSTEDVSNSLVFDKQRNSVWAQGVEYGIPGVEANDYQEDTTFLNTVIDDTVTDRPVQVFRGYGNVEYSLYVNQSGNLCVYGFIPIDITTLQSGKMNGSSFAQTNKISVEIGNTVSTELTHMKLLLNGSSVPVDGSTANSSVKELRISITGKMTATKDFTRSSNAAFLNAIRKTNIWSFSDLNITIPSGANDLGKTLGTTSMDVQIWDVKNNTDTASITMVEVYDKCYYFHVPEDTIDELLGRNNGENKLTYQDLESFGTNGSGTSNLRFEWTSGSLSSRTLNSTAANTLDKTFYVLVPSRYNATQYKSGAKISWYALENFKTITFINSSNYTASYKLYRADTAFGGATGWSLTLSNA